MHRESLEKKTQKNAEKRWRNQLEIQDEKSLAEQQLEQDTVEACQHVEELGIEQGEGLLSVADAGDSRARGKCGSGTNESDLGLTMAKNLLAGAACDTVPRGKWGVWEAEKMPGQILGCPQVLSGRWVGDDRGFSWCQQPGIAGKGSSCQEKPHNLPRHRNPQQKRRAVAGF